MGNIVGEYFDKEIVEQIKQRQKIYGSINRDNDQLTYLNTRTGWCRLVSSVNVDDNLNIRKFNLEKGSDLAKENVLFAGISDGIVQRSGISQNDSVFNNDSYGFGGLEFGLRPMPGIISAEIKTETRGSIKRATVRVQANNRQQFDIIDLLYLRLGYSVLLEWGQSSYYNNKGIYNPDNPYNLLYDFLNPELSGLNYNTILDRIQQNRLDSYGNYDAIFAKVVNFSWTFTKEGTYDITINLISLGDVIESLKTNILFGNETRLPSEIRNEEALINTYSQTTQQNSGLTYNPDDKILINYPDTSVETLTYVAGKLDLSYTVNETNRPLNKLSNGLTVGKDFDLTRAQNVTQLPSILKVGGTLTIDGTGITTLPDGLTVGKDFSAFDRPITSLPSDLKVGGNANFRYSKIAILPKTVYIGGNIDLRNTPLETTLLTQKANKIYPSNSSEGEKWREFQRDLRTEYPEVKGYFIIGNFDAEEPDNVFYNPSVYVSTQGAITSISTFSTSPSEVIETYRYQHNIGYYFGILQDQLSSNNLLTNPSNPDDIVAAKITYNSPPEGIKADQYYIQFAWFLEYIQNNIIPNIDYDPALSLLKIDNDIFSNLIATNNYTISDSPGVCIFKTDYVDSAGNVLTLFDELNDFFTSYSNNIKYGKIMNVYFNMDYILKEMNSKKDIKTGAVSLYNLLDICCKGFNTSTGNFNDIEPTVNTENNTIRFIDSTSLPNRNEILKTFGNTFNTTDQAVFDVYGYNKVNNTSSAGFIKDLSFTTTVSPRLATMITVGATNQGYVVGEDATALSRMNADLTDRFKKNITNPTETGPSNTSIPLEEQYKKPLIAYSNFIYQINRLNWNENAVTDMQSVHTSLIEYSNNKQLQSSSILLAESGASKNSYYASANSGFLPFDLSLTMDGLSGMKVYQSFLMDTDFLPSNYPESLEFLIKGITHRIENNQWTTRIESMAIPKNPFGSNTVNRSVRNATFSTNTLSTTRIIEGIKYTNGEIPNNKLRPINNASKYVGSIQSDNGNIRLYEKASIALDNLIAAAERDGVPVYINSAYRTYQDQVRIRSQYPNSSATPGTSNHGFGLAVDFATPSPYRKIKPGDKLYNWLSINGATYGFARIASESWHWEYQI